MIKKEKLLKGIASVVVGILIIMVLFTGTTVASDIYLGDRYYYYLYDDLPAGITLYAEDGTPIGETIPEGDKVYIRPVAAVKTTSSPIIPTESPSTSTPSSSATPAPTDTITQVPDPIKTIINQKESKKDNTTVIPVTEAGTLTSTSKSPAPFIGLMAGLGVAVLLCRQRR